MLKLIYNGYMTDSMLHAQCSYSPFPRGLAVCPIIYKILGQLRAMHWSSSSVSCASVDATATVWTKWRVVHSLLQAKLLALYWSLHCMNKYRESVVWLYLIIHKLNLHWLVQKDVFRYIVQSATTVLHCSDGTRCQALVVQLATFHPVGLESDDLILERSVFIERKGQPWFFRLPTSFYSQPWTPSHEDFK
jgi:hypothetical protein